jgi:hypothetical protein
MQNFIRSLGWDTLNRAAVLVTLATGVRAILSLMGAQSFAIWLLYAVAVASITIAIYRAKKYSAIAEQKDKLVAILLEHGKFISTELSRVSAGNLLISDYGKAGEIVDRERLALQNVLTSLSSAMEAISKSKVNCAVKLCTIEEGNVFAQTFVSTYSAPRKLEEEGRKLQLDHNTIYKAAIEQVKVVVLNDLPRVSQYMDENGAWPTNYTNCAVVPLVHLSPDSDSKTRQIAGFLSVDSKGASGFPDGAMEVLQFYADWCSLFLTRMYRSSDA